VTLRAAASSDDAIWFRGLMSYGNFELFVAAANECRPLLSMLEKEIYSRGCAAGLLAPPVF
jgi:hypothetical protein